MKNFKNRQISELEGPSPDLSVILFIHEQESVGISRMIEEGIASKGALERILRDKMFTGYIERDLSNVIPGKPYKLTEKGKKVAIELHEIERIIAK